MYDLLLQRGEVLDPGAGLHGQLDIAISRNRIAAVEFDLPTEAAFRVVDARGLLVTPALIDLHTHIYHHVTYWVSIRHPWPRAAG